MLLWGSCIKILQDPLQQQVPLWLSSEILFGVLAWRSWSRSFTLPCDKILVRSARYLCMVSYRLLWENLVEILLKSFSRGPCVKILKIFEDALRWCWSESSSWMLLGSSLSRSSEILCIEGPSLTIFCTSPRCPGMRFWYEVFMSRHSVDSCANTSSAAANTMMSSLICYCSIAAAACI